MNQSRPLDGIVVVELASVLAGPSVGSFLAELGATVIKIENPKTGGDTTRNWKSSGENPDAAVSSYYASANWKKEVVYLDLTVQSDMGRLHGFLASADILLENFKPGDDTKFKLDYKSLKSLYSNIIVGHIQGFPDNDRTAFDLVLQAETGFMSLNGQDGDALKWPLPIVDILAAHQLKEGLLVALLQRSKNLQGCFVSVSLFEAALASLYNIAGNVLMGHANPKSLGRLHPNIAPYGETISTSDGVTLVLAIGTDRQFFDLCSILEIEAAFKEKFSTNSIRLLNRNSIEVRLREGAIKQSFSVLESKLILKKVPFGRVRTVREVLNDQPENAFLRETIDGVNTVRMRTAIFRIVR